MARVAAAVSQGYSALKAHAKPPVNASIVAYPPESDPFEFIEPYTCIHSCTFSGYRFTKACFIYKDKGCFIYKGEG